MTDDENDVRPDRPYLDDEGFPHHREKIAWRADAESRDALWSIKEAVSDDNDTARGRKAALDRLREHGRVGINEIAGEHVRFLEGASFAFGFLPVIVKTGDSYVLDPTAREQLEIVYSPSYRPRT